MSNDSNDDRRRPFSFAISDDGMLDSSYPSIVGRKRTTAPTGIKKKRIPNRRRNLLESSSSSRELFGEYGGSSPPRRRRNRKLDRKDSHSRVSPDSSGEQEKEIPFLNRTATFDAEIFDCDSSPCSEEYASNIDDDEDDPRLVLFTEKILRVGDKIFLAKIYSID